MPALPVNDSAGGDVENAVWREVLQNKAVVQDLESCFRCQRKVP